VKNRTSIQETPDRRERRRKAILEAARTLFLRHGFDAVSLSDVVARSGGSLSTLYDLFGSKRGLLRAVMHSQFSQDIERVDDMLGRGGPPHDVLLEVALGTQEYLAAPDMVSFMRFVAGESLRSPEFGARFFEDVHQSFVERYAALFARWSAEGRLRIDDPALAARQFISLILHDLHVRAIYAGGGSHPDRREAERAVALFLDHYRR
jgi:TetR/AcrR family transcriptional repressor of mexJK operon